MLQTKLIVHNQDDINVIWVQFVRHVTSKHDQTRKMISSLRQNQDVKQTPGNKSALLRTLAKSLNKSLCRGAMHAWCKITKLITWRQFHGRFLVIMQIVSRTIN